MLKKLRLLAVISLLVISCLVPAAAAAPVQGQNEAGLRYIDFLT